MYNKITTATYIFVSCCFMALTGLEIAARAAARGQTPEQARAESVKDIPVGRIGAPDEFGAVAAFLASPLAAYVTGSLIRVDGGAVRVI